MQNVIYLVMLTNCKGFVQISAKNWWITMKFWNDWAVSGVYLKYEIQYGL